MMQVKMLRGARGTEDGFTVKFYEADKEYEVATSLGSTFVRNGDAERVGGDEVETDPVAQPVEAAAPLEQKDAGPAPENKDLGKAPKNKSKAKPDAPVYEAGNVYEVDGVVCLAAAPNPGDDVALLPVEQLPDGERQALVDEGKLTADGKVPAAS